MKNIIFSLVLAISSFVVNATTVTQSIELGSDNLYRGQSISNDNGYVELDFTLSDIMIDGLFFHTNASTAVLAPLGDDVRSRSEYGVGYKHSLGSKFNGVVSVYRIEDLLSYTETRAGLEWTGLTSENVNLVVYGNVGYTAGNGVYNNTYAETGVLWRDALTVNGLDFDFKVSGYDYEYNGETRLNNVELTATYNFWKELEAFATFSYGGNDVLDNDISSQGLVGARWRF